MRTIHASIKTALLILAALSFSRAVVRADSYSQTNFQSDIAGVAQHVDPNLVNPWGMAASPNGTIWVSSPRCPGANRPAATVTSRSTRQVSD